MRSSRFNNENCKGSITTNSIVALLNINESFHIWLMLIENKTTTQQFL